MTRIVTIYYDTLIQNGMYYTSNRVDTSPSLILIGH